MRLLFIVVLLANSTNSFAQSDWLQKIQGENDSICQVELVLKFDSNQHRFGFVDESGQYRIEAKFRCATEFIDCLALVSKKDKKCDPSGKNAKGWFYINKSNAVVIPPRSENRPKWDNNIESSP